MSLYRGNNEHLCCRGDDERSISWHPQLARPTARIRITTPKNGVNFPLYAAAAAADDSHDDKVERTRPTVHRDAAQDH